MVLCKIVGVGRSLVSNSKNLTQKNIKTKGDKKVKTRGTVLTVLCPCPLGEKMLEKVVKNDQTINKLSSN